MNEDMEYCYKCGVSTRSPYQRHPSDQMIHYWTPVVAGILILIASIYCLTHAISFLRVGYYQIWDDLDYWGSAFFIIGIIYIFGFYFGLRGSILIFQRKNFKFAFGTVIFLAICGAIPLVFWSNTSIILLLAIIGIVILWYSKDVFDRPVGEYDKQREAMPPFITPPHDAKPKPSAAQRLKELKELRKERLITEKEFEEKRKKLAQEL
ncbi:MAG: hypothetical protein JSV49_03660 [Thermoplasmata archaeon]|nr:MAG: hypothetical protein JSV49_03660 [Thermoplasmata archaeon]